VSLHTCNVTLTIHEMEQFSGPFKGMHSMLCMDGNLQHKRSCSAGKGDQPLQEPHSFFIPEDIVSMMEKEVNNKRQTRPHHALEDDQDAVLPGLELQNHIFEGCTDRFKAAKGSYEKAESSIFADTGLMSLTCRHDRVIFMVNLHDAGERQYNALALIQQLFLELPENWNVGILYDIGCQLHRSITKVCIFDTIVQVKNLLTYFSSIISCPIIPTESLLQYQSFTHLGMSLHANVFITHKNVSILGVRMVKAVRGFGTSC
jgi:hypothetical protein